MVIIIISRLVREKVPEGLMFGLSFEFQQMLARKEESLAKYQEMLKEAREVRSS